MARMKTGTDRCICRCSAPGATTAPVVNSAPTEVAKVQFPKMHATVTELAKETKMSPTAPVDRNPLADKVFEGSGTTH